MQCEIGDDKRVAHREGYDTVSEKESGPGDEDFRGQEGYSNENNDQGGVNVTRSNKRKLNGSAARGDSIKRRREESNATQTEVDKSGSSPNDDIIQKASQQSLRSVRVPRVRNKHPAFNPFYSILGHEYYNVKRIEVGHCVGKTVVGTRRFKNCDEDSRCVRAIKNIAKGEVLFDLRGAVIIEWQNENKKSFNQNDRKYKKDVILDALHVANIDPSEVEGFVWYPFYEADDVENPIHISFASPAAHIGCCVNVNPTNFNCTYELSLDQAGGEWLFKACEDIIKGHEVVLGSYIHKKNGVSWDQRKYAIET